MTGQQKKKNSETMVQPTSPESQLLFDQARRADPQAAADLHDRYADRLLALVRGRINRQLQPRFDAEDVVNSAFRSFFCSLADDRFSLPHQGGLWPLLAQITIHKLHRAAHRHRRQRRNVHVEADTAAAVETPTHDHLAELALRDELRWLSEKLPPRAATAMELSIDGYSHDEIATQLNCTTRSVRRYIAEARALLRFRLGLATAANTSAQVSAASVIDLTFDHYLLRRLIGAGTFGKVYLATDKTSGADVAVKYLRRKWTRQRQVVDRFVAETNLLGGLDVDGVVPCLGGGATPDGGRFIVMKWIDGQTLADQIAQQPLSEFEAQRKFAALAMTLHQVHQQGITHCDLKPTNILIDRDDRWWVTDFGFASQQSKPTAAIAGTPKYMAPEQRDPLLGPIGPWTDLYAVGVMMIESLGCDLADHPARNLSLQGRMSPALMDTIAMLLQPRIEQRISSARELQRRFS